MKLAWYIAKLVCVQSIIRQSISCWKFKKKLPISLGLNQCSIELSKQWCMETHVSWNTLSAWSVCNSICQHAYTLFVIIVYRIIFCLKSRLPFEPNKWHNTLERRRSDRKDDIYVLHTFDMLLLVGFLPFIYDLSENSSQESAEIQAQIVFKLKVSLWFLKSHFLFWFSFYFAVN